VGGSPALVTVPVADIEGERGRVISHMRKPFEASRVSNVIEQTPHRSGFDRHGHM
jgi:hypothetical protein